MYLYFSPNGTPWASTFMIGKTDKYGKNCTAYIEQTKEEREFSRDKIYVGSGWVTKFEEKKQENAQEVNSSLDSGDSDTSDLPF